MLALAKAAKAAEEAAAEPPSRQGLDRAASNGSGDETCLPRREPPSVPLPSPSFLEKARAAEAAAEGGETSSSPTAALLPSAHNPAPVDVKEIHAGLTAGKKAGWGKLNALKAMGKAAVFTAHKEARFRGQLGETVKLFQSKEEAMNDVTNTGVAAALVGGFALSAIQGGHYEFRESIIDNIIYLLLVMGVHANTCSALTSAILYREINAKSDDDALAWAQKNWILMMAPAMKFGMGTVAYIISVIFFSYRFLEEVPITQFIACFIGVSSMMTVFMTIYMVYKPEEPKPAK